MKLLKRCKEAIPTRENRGEVINYRQSYEHNKWRASQAPETQLYFDIHMMVHTTGKQRTEEEWKKLFTETGFKGYNPIPALGLRSII